jgi:HK97 family phage major capsid protein
MPNLDAGKVPIAFGNFKNAYQIIDRGDVGVLRDPFTHKPYIKFYSTKKVGGDIVNFEAIKLLEIAS